MASSAVWSYLQTEITVGGAGEVWLTLHEEYGSNWGTVFTQIDGVPYNVHDTNNPVVNWAGGKLETVRVATGLKPGVHTIRLTNWPSPSLPAGSWQNNLWIFGIGYTVQ
jgi:hypothetical protein